MSGNGRDDERTVFHGMSFRIRATCVTAAWRQTDYRRTSPANHQGRYVTPCHHGGAPCDNGFRAIQRRGDIFRHRLPRPRSTCAKPAANSERPATRKMRVLVLQLRNPLLIRVKQTRSARAASSSGLKPRLLFVLHIAARAHRDQPGQHLIADSHLDVLLAQLPRRADRFFIRQARPVAIEARGKCRSRCQHADHAQSPSNTSFDALVAVFIHLQSIVNNQQAQFRCTFVTRMNWHIFIDKPCGKTAHSISCSRTPPSP
jgi:hypothetical protein